MAQRAWGTRSPRRGCGAGARSAFTRRARKRWQICAHPTVSDARWRSEVRCSLIVSSPRACTTQSRNSGTAVSGSCKRRGVHVLLGPARGGVRSHEAAKTAPPQGDRRHARPPQPGARKRTNKSGLACILCSTLLAYLYSSDGRPPAALQRRVCTHPNCVAATARVACQRAQGRRRLRQRLCAQCAGFWLAQGAIYDAGHARSVPAARFT
jgi:hypothetical protein